MGSKKDGKEEQTESQEITGTLTDLGYKASDANSEAVLKKLLGSRPLKTTSSTKVLLMPEKSSSRTDLLRLENVDGTRVSDRALCVFGPYDASELKKKALDGLLRRGDRLLFASSRWKPVLEEFPEWNVHISGNDEFSRTMEMTQTNTLNVETEEGIEIEEQALSKGGTLRTRVGAGTSHSWASRPFQRSSLGSRKTWSVTLARCTVNTSGSNASCGPSATASLSNSKEWPSERCERARPQLVTPAFRLRVCPSRLEQGACAGDRHGDRIEVSGEEARGLHQSRASTIFLRNFARLSRPQNRCFAPSHP